MNTLPADLLRSIAGELHGKNAARLATVSTAFKEVIRETHPTLPVGPPKYVAGTGKFQKQYKTLLKMLAKKEYLPGQTKKIVYACILGEYAFRQARAALKKRALVHLVSVEWTRDPSLAPLLKQIRKALKKMRYTAVLDEIKKSRRKSEKTTTTKNAALDESMGDRLMDAVLQSIAQSAALEECI